MYTAVLHVFIQKSIMLQTFPISFGMTLACDEKRGVDKIGWIYNNFLCMPHMDSKWQDNDLQLYDTLARSGKN